MLTLRSTRGLLFVFAVSKQFVVKHKGCTCNYIAFEAGTSSLSLDYSNQKCKFVVLYTFFFRQFQVTCVLTDVNVCIPDKLFVSLLTMQPNLIYIFVPVSTHNVSCIMYEGSILCKGFRFLLVPHNFTRGLTFV